MNQTSFLLFRVAIGMSLLGHGLVRLPKLATFSQWMVGLFAKSMLPEFLVTPFSYLLPIAEFVIGLLLVLGLFTRPALMAGAWMMIFLIFGTCLLENWDALPSQLIHVAFLAGLLNFTQSNTWALDHVIFKNNARG
ncbi:DoxX family membrane protein [Adhaeribacter swui]|uniref:DoxX family membrane protein n=1 Tax=Adhaeribacter swui TaxID=2086471 RepID=A0A7G7G4Y7_9BACT|nr:DoxX family membrane protein [Adhaeribacter swui]QNF32221.1 DoxX family membrane protein [Adhaeribacter swui]